MPSHVQHFLNAVSTLSFLCFVVLVAVSLADPRNQTDGLLLIEIGDLNTTAVNRTTTVGGLRHREVLDRAESINNLLETMLPAAEPRARDTTGEVATSVATSATASVAGGTNETTAGIMSAVPRNYSLGTQRFCAGYAAGRLCGALPPRLTQLLPQALASRRPDVFNATVLVDEALSVAQSAALVQGPVVLGLVVLAVPLLVLLVSSYEWPLKVRRALESRRHHVFLALWLFAMSGLALAAGPVIAVVIMQSRLRSVPEWITVHPGRAGDALIAGMSCAVVSVATNQTLWRHTWNREKYKLVD
ncbi:hypothetical protein CGCA056_v007806 [Colletotrichum aenigma]|uniref:uncharacterized protein n=1 Tax=Colletotrichum aenigma TaxID=1215731 RepID=UPI001872C31F|nr:uncharacterized protein CGCA056_v007806 [Colletotrichum aenigma]KAF5520974.1 hypothetical protein CGCA056_v007806 [Colletotrichum aenigma]